MPLDLKLGPFQFSYNAVASGGRRRNPVSVLQSEDDNLKAAERRKLVATARDARVNLPLAAWALRCHISYVADHRFHALNNGPAVDAAVTAHVENWSKPQNFDVARRHGRRRFARLAEGSRTIDGDVFILKTPTGAHQAIEGDRVRDPFGPADVLAKIAPESYVHGLETTRAGALLSIAVHRRAGAGGLIFERPVRARNVEHFGYFERFDQTRGITLIASAITTMQDLVENMSLAQAKMKVTQIFGLALFRVQPDPTGDVTDADGNPVTKADRKIDFSKGPVALELDPDDKAEILESGTPSNEFQNFFLISAMMALRALDIPMCFFDEKHANYAGQKLAGDRYEKSVAAKREDMQELLGNLTRHELWRAWLAGELILPRGMTPDAIKFQYVPDALPWYSNARESAAALKAIQGGTGTLTAFWKERNRDFRTEVIPEIAADNQALADAGITLATAGNATTPAKEPRD